MKTREIKFRAQNNLNEWVELHGDSLRAIEEPELFGLKNVVEYTGLKDKNGKEIYEGDIFDCIYDFDGCKKHKLEIIWNEKSAGFSLRNHGECHQPNVSKTLCDIVRQEIIGNIYENKELLK